MMCCVIVVQLMGLSERCQSIEEKFTVINNKLSCKVSCVCVCACVRAWVRVCVCVCVCTVSHATSILIYIIVCTFFHATIVSPILNL